MQYIKLISDQWLFNYCADNETDFDENNTLLRRYAGMQSNKSKHQQRQ